MPKDASLEQAASAKERRNLAGRMALLVNKAIRREFLWRELGGNFSGGGTLADNFDIHGGISLALAFDRGWSSF